MLLYEQSANTLQSQRQMFNSQALDSFAYISFVHVLTG